MSPPFLTNSTLKADLMCSDVTNSLCVHIPIISLQLPLLVFIFKNLVKDLESELSGDFKEGILSLMMQPVELDAYSLNKAMKGLGTNEGTLIGILCSKSAAEMNDIKKAYKNSKYIFFTNSIF